MKKLSLAIVLAISVAGCSRGDAFEIPTGSDVTVEKKDGVTVAGKLVEVQPEQVVLEASGGTRTSVRRTDIKSIASAPAAVPGAAATPSAPVATSGSTPDDARGESAPAPVADSASSEDPDSKVREITIPAGTLLPVELQSSVASDTSSPEDPVRGTLRRAVTINGVQVLPAGAALTGHVTSAQRSAKVKGRASVAFRFNRIDVPGAGGRMAITSSTISRTAAATKKKDAAKIGGGAAGGAIIGGILGGGDGAAKGAAIGGAAGTGVVLATRGEEVRLGPGLALSVRLTQPLTVRVR